MILRTKIAIWLITKLIRLISAKHEYEIFRLLPGLLNKVELQKKAKQKAYFKQFEIIRSGKPSSSISYDLRKVVENDKLIEISNKNLEH